MYDHTPWQRPDAAAPAEQDNGWQPPHPPSPGPAPVGTPDHEAQWTTPADFTVHIPHFGQTKRGKLEQLATLFGLPPRGVNTDERTFYQLDWDPETRIQAFEQELHRTRGIRSWDDRPVAYTRVVALLLPRKVPELAIGRRYEVQRARLWFGQPDSRVANPEFHRNFVIDTADLEFAQHVLTPTMCQRLMEDPRTHHYPLRFLGSWLGCALPGRFDWNDARAQRDFLLAVGQRLPADLRVAAR